MSLQPGTALGPSRIQASLVAGVRGKVYKAIDTQLSHHGYPGATGAPRLERAVQPTVHRLARNTNQVRPWHGRIRNNLATVVSRESPSGRHERPHDGRDAAYLFSHGNGAGSLRPPPPDTTAFDSYPMEHHVRRLRNRHRSST